MDIFHIQIIGLWILVALGYLVIEKLAIKKAVNTGKSNFLIKAPQTDTSTQISETDFKAVTGAAIKSAVDINGTGETGMTLLHVAANINSNPDVIFNLIMAGADVNAKDKSGSTPLHFAAAKSSNPEVLTTLIKAGANIIAKNDFDITPLHVSAFSNNNPEILSTLIKAGADVNAKDINGETPLAVAKAKGNTKAISVLESAGAKE